ncbi:MAG: hypothetical protein SV765_03155 [Pseudomonadota bacterium]|nr:hypothetical protein [Pseudomonadota bacterium]
MVKKTCLALLPLSLCISSVPVLAASTAELEQRLEQQERQIKRLENRLRGTRAAVKENRSRLSDAADRLKINGFLSAGASTIDSQQLYEPFYGVYDNLRSESVNKVGVQFNFEVSDNIDVTAQLMSKGVNDYSTEAEWLYLNYQATDNLAFKIGRQRIPYYLLSEYLDVGFAYPWVRPPLEMYNVPVASFDGVSAYYGISLGDVRLSFQPYVGSSTGYSDQLENAFETNQQYGLAAFADYKNFTFRVGFNTSHVDVRTVDEGAVSADLITGVDTALAAGTVVNGLAQGLAAATSNPAFLGFVVPPTVEPFPKNSRTLYTSAGFSYDDGSLLVMGEIANLRVEDLPQPGGDGGYFTVGYRFGKWMPHATFAKYYTDSAGDEYMNEYLEYFNDVASNTAALAPTADGASVPLPAELTAQGFSSWSQYSTVVGAGLADLHNGLATLNQQQQSYTLGVVYDVSPRVKAKLEATHYENFGNYDYVTGYTGAGPTTVSVNGDGRFSQVVDEVDEVRGVDSGPPANKDHTAIYSFSIEAVF